MLVDYGGIIFAKALSMKEQETRFMKKTISIILLLITILSFTACAKPTANVSNATQMPLPTEAVVEAPAPTPTQYPETATIEVENLKDYTIVYPSTYNEFRMDIVNELKNVIDTVTGGNVKTASDAEAVDGNKIILASAITEHSFKTEIENFQSRMDYIVAVDGNNIVLGGKNYYSDLRAVYDFMESNLGYTSIGNVYSEDVNALKGVEITLYKEPDFIIEAATWGPLFTKEEHMKDLHDGNFNMLMTHLPGFGDTYGEEGAHNVTKWAAKYEIQILWNNDRQSTLPYAEVYWDCPMVYGGHIWDEPEKKDIAAVEKLCQEFIDNYGQYGWVPFVNFSLYDPDMPYATTGTEAVCSDWYIFMQQSGAAAGMNFLEYLEDIRTIAQLKQKKFWMYIQAFRAKDGYFNASKAYRWQMYMEMCFGVEGIFYFTYSSYNEESEEISSWCEPGSNVMSPTLEKGENYYYAQKANAEVLKAYDVLKDYENLGAYSINKKRYSYVNGQDVYGEFTEYRGFDMIDELVAPIGDDGKKSSYLVGCFEKENGDGKAMILMNFDFLNGVEYGEDMECLTKIKLNGKNPKFYFEGELMDLQPDADGYYTINVPNGHCWVVTVE